MVVRGVASAGEGRIGMRREPSGVLAAVVGERRRVRGGVRGRREAGAVHPGGAGPSGGVVPGASEGGGAVERPPAEFRGGTGRSGRGEGGGDGLGRVFGGVCDRARGGEEALDEGEADAGAGGLLGVFRQKRVDRAI